MMKHNNFQWAYHITLHPPPTPPKQGKLTEGSLNPVKIQKCTQNWLVVEAYPYVSFSRKDGSLPGNALCREVSTNWNETIWKKPAFSQVGINPKMSLPPLPDRFLKRERSTTELGDTQTTTSSLNAYVHIFGCSPSPLCLSCVVAPWSLLVTAFAPLNLSQADGLFPLVFKGPEAL
jgi:hypothetical protein